jgi:hypothetical protein
MKCDQVRNLRLRGTAAQRLEQPAHLRVNGTVINQLAYTVKISKRRWLTAGSILVSSEECPAN